MINAHPGVSHNYLRNHEFNLWFTIATPPDSELGLDGHARRSCSELTGAESIRQLPTLTPVQDQHEPGDGEAAPRRSPRDGRGGRRRASSRRSPTTTRDIAVIRAAPGPDGGRRAALRRGRRRGRDDAPRSCSRTCDGMIDRKHPAPGRGDPLPPPRRLLGQRHGRLAGARGATIAEVGGRMAAVRGHLALLPAPDLRRLALLASSRWPTAAPRRSATRSSTRSPTSTTCTATIAPTLYSSTEFKKIRLRYFTDDYADWEREHA